MEKKRTFLVSVKTRGKRRVVCLCMCAQANESEETSLSSAVAWVCV